MKVGLSHVPEHRQHQIGAIADLLRDNAPIEMLILFGSYARGDWVEDLPNGYLSDWDFMVLVANDAVASDDALWSSLSRRAGAIAGRIPVSLMVHTVREMNQEIRSGQYFFSDVVNEGILLYTSNRHQLARPKALNAGERLALSLHNFRYWFESASGFWRGAGYYAIRDLRCHAAFLLHQATERYFHAALLVFTGYKPKTHDIELLANQTAPLHRALEGALPRAAGEDERLFKLLKRAYIDARYSKSFSVTGEELAVLSERVLDLGARVRTACEEKLGTFCGAEAVGPLSDVPTAAEVGDLPAAPPLDDAEAFEKWAAAVASLSFERGEEKGRREGSQEAQARAVLTVLQVRGIDVPKEARKRILAEQNLEQLARWLEKAAMAASLADVLDASGGEQSPRSD
jgi:predicted nucleotidyltransferase/HEPN domain-containing protein